MMNAEIAKVAGEVNPQRLQVVVITGDTGIHPSATGYTQMASQVPAPE